MSALKFLWINLMTDVFPALALSFEPADPGVMSRPPRNPAEPILSRRELTRIAGDSALISATTLGIYGASLGRYGVGTHASTVAFSALTSAQLCYALTCRSDERSGLAGLGRNLWLVTALGGTLALQLGAVTLPFLRGLLGTASLAAADWALVAAGAATPLVVSRKLSRRQLVEGGGPPG
jgi:Ca2+-transporting ATPase